jgi:Zn-dependent M28 family amino/carboxypeptidase
MVMRTKNSKICIKSMIFSVIILLLHGNGISAQNVWVREHEPARLMISEERLEREIGFLSDSLCQGRGTGTGGGSAAAFWLHRKFENAGLLKFDGSYSQNVWISRELTGHNIVGMLPGSHKKQCDRYIIVGAHYDHIGELSGKMYPGADANASGTVAMINLAEMIMGIRNYGKSHNYNIIFVAFDGKEQSMAGSYAFWKLIEEGALTDPQTGKVITREKITLMVNIDQIGSTMSPLSSRRKDYMIMLGNESVKPNKRELLHSCNKQFGIDLDLDLTYYGSHDFTKMFYRLSDQRVFVDNGIPAVLFTSGITMNTNKTWDTPETIDIEVFKKRIFLMYHWIEKMIQ